MKVLSVGRALLSDECGEKRNGNGEKNKWEWKKGEAEKLRAGCTRDC